MGWDARFSFFSVKSILGSAGLVLMEKIKRNIIFGLIFMCAQTSLIWIVWIHANRYYCFNSSRFFSKQTTMKLIILSSIFLLASFSVTGSSAWASPPIVSSSKKDGYCLHNTHKKMSSTRLHASVELAPAEIIGGGRIGSLLGEGGASKILGRDDPIDPEASGPILVATRNDALDGIVEKCPEHRRKDLVFMQNGYLDRFLEAKGLLDNTQVLLYLAVTAKGVDPVDGITSVNPDGLTAATGVHAQAFADRLDALNLKCNVISTKTYRPAMFEKLIWISTYMLVGTAKGCKSVGEAGSEHGDLVEQVVNELVAAVSTKEGIVFEEGTMKRLAAYTDIVSNFPCGVKEFEWRNQYFYDLGDAACPTHNALLRECAEKGLIGFELP